MRIEVLLTFGMWSVAGVLAIGLAQTFAADSVNHGDRQPATQVSSFDFGCDPNTVGPEFLLDLGGVYDADPRQPIFLLNEPGVSRPRTEPGTGRSFRSLDPEGSNRTGRLEFRVNPASVPLQPNGVPDCGRMPRCDAIIDIDYQDVADETNCSSFDELTTQCRPRLCTRLDFGAEPEIESWAVIGPFAGLGDGKWKTARFFIEATPWQTLRALPEGKPQSRGPRRFQFRILYPQPKGPANPLPISRIALRFVDRACFHALREADRTARTLVRKEHVESNSIDARVYPGERYVIYQRNYLQKIYPNSVPAAAEILRGAADLRAFEIRGETEPITFALYAFENLGGVQVGAGALTRREGREPRSNERTDIPPENLRIYRVVAADKRWAADRDPYYGLQPWWLDEAQPFAVAAQTSQQLWVSVDVPADAAPGIYTGEIRITVAPGSSSPASSRNLPLAITVYDVALGQPDVLPYMYHSPFAPGVRYAKTPEIAARDMAALGIRSVNTWLCPTWQWKPQECAAGRCAVTASLSPAAINEINGLRAAGVLDGNLYCFVSDARQALWERLCRDQQGRSVPFCSSPCPEFDRVYGGILAEYHKACEQHGVRPVVAFVDEPGSNPTRRREAEHLNRLAKKAGLNTQVCYYYPVCDEPLAGWKFTFSQLTGEIAVKPSPWRPGGPRDDPKHLMAYWDFTEAGSVQSDRSGHGNAGTLHGRCEAFGGRLQLEDQDAYMWVNPGATLNLSRQATISFWFRPDAYPTQCMAPVICKADRSANHIDYAFYYYGLNPSCGQKGLEGLLQFRATIDGVTLPVAGDARLTPADFGNWCNVTWTYDAAKSGTMYINGVALSVPSPGPLTTYAGGLTLGAFKGALAEVVILDRAATEEEVADLVRSATNPAYADKHLVLSATLPPGRMPPSSEMVFSLVDAVSGPAGLETTKRLEVNGEIVWEYARLPDRYGIYRADVGSRLRPGQENVVKWTFINGYAREESLALYFVDDFWRGINWTPEPPYDSHWNSSYIADPPGDLGPMAPWLDEPVYSLFRVNQEALHHAQQSPGGFAFYAPYVTTRPVIINNRFIYGLYASALGARRALVYAYADWGPQPWDDLVQSTSHRMGGSANALRGAGGYGLALPSWESRIYPTVIHESFREGIEDSRIIAALKQAIADHPGPVARQAEEFLNGLLAKPSREFRRYSAMNPRLPIERHADRTAEILSDLADGDAAAFGVFDENRRRMVEFILQLTEGGI